MLSLASGHSGYSPALTSCPCCPGKGRGQRLRAGANRQDIAGDRCEHVCSVHPALTQLFLSPHLPYSEECYCSVWCKVFPSASVSFHHIQSTPFPVWSLSICSPHQRVWALAALGGGVVRCLRNTPGQCLRVSPGDAKGVCSARDRTWDFRQLSTATVLCGRSSWHTASGPRRDRLLGQGELVTQGDLGTA